MYQGGRCERREIALLTFFFVHNNRMNAKRDQISLIRGVLNVSEQKAGEH